jgi:hypothetical protein
MRMLFLILSLVVFVGGASAANSDGPPVIIDVPKELYQRLNIPPDFFKIETCSNRTGCTKYCPTRPTCKSKYEFSNLVIDKILSIEFKEPDPNSLPTYKENQQKTINNCWSTEYPHKELIKYGTQQSLASTNSSVLSQVRGHDVSVSLSATFMGAIGVSVSDKVSNTTTISTSWSETKAQSESFNIEQTFEFKIPPKVQRTLIYSDLKKRAEIPVTIKGALAGDILVNEYIKEDGTLWASHLSSRLWNKATEEQRTFLVTGVVVPQGSNRSLVIDLKEAPAVCADEYVEHK